MNMPRYAIYFAPDPASPLWHFGSECLGYDSAKGDSCDLFVPRGLDEGLWYESTQTPRRYGFHATLKAPFYLQSDYCEDDLIEAVSLFSARQMAVIVPAFCVARMGDFLALLPSPQDERLHSLAARIVETFDTYRAPLSIPDRARRLEVSLSERQTAYLDLWGYPYVFDEFRFHMTLTGSLPADIVEIAKAEIEELYAHKVGPAPVTIDSIVLARQDNRDGKFKIIDRGRFSAPRTP